MSTANNKAPYFKRLGIVFLIAFSFVILFNEVAYRLQKEDTDRAPKTIQLVIPAGTADKVAAGEDSVSIPDEMVFVLGDVLEVVNQDEVSHQLGPIFVPPGATGSLIMDKVENLAYSCSFQTGNYFGLDIKKPTTFGTRLLALGLAAPSLTALLYIYSLLALPIKTTPEAANDA